MIRVATRARSVDELVAKLAPFAHDDGIVIPASPGVAAGVEDRLVIELADRRVVLSGTVRVDDAAGALRFTFRELDPEGRRVHERLLARRRLDSTRMRLPTPGGGRSEASVMMPLPAGPAPPEPAALRALIERVTVEATNDLQAQNPTRKLSLAPAPFPERPGPELGNDDETVVAISSEDVEPAEVARARRPSMPPLPLPAPLPAAPDDLPPLRAPSLVPDEPAGLRRSGVARQPDAVERLVVMATSDVARSRVRTLAPWLIAGVLGFAIGRLTVGAPSPPAPVATEKVAPEPPPTPPPVTPPPAAPVEAAPPPTCKATIRSEPSATVQWGEATLGDTPLVDVQVPCGRALVALRRPRYQQLVRNVEAGPTQPVAMQERLARPEAQLVVTTRPPGARVWINGQERGRTPQELSVARYETSRVQVKLDGHPPASKKVYVDKAIERIDLPLAKGKK